MSEEQEWETGIFCRHWASDGDCEETCASCGHLCGYHRDDECDHVNPDGTYCDCEGWKGNE